MRKARDPKSQCVSFYADTCSFFNRHAFPQCLRSGSRADPKLGEEKWRLRKLRGVHAPFVQVRQRWVSTAVPSARLWKRCRIPMVRADTPAARANRPKKFVQQLVNEPQVKHQIPSSPTIFVLICAADSHLGELSRVLELNGLAACFR